jgi:hypothetical protein
MVSRAIVLSLLLLAACGQSATTKAPEAPASAALNPQDLGIEIGRYGAMLDQVRTLTADLPDVESPDGEPTDVRALARSLRERAWAYNLERSRLCARGLYTAQSCGPVFEPVWLSDPADAQPSLDEIKTRADALGAEVQPFWNAVCDDIRARTTGAQEKAYVCAIE